MGALSLTADPTPLSLDRLARASVMLADYIEVVRGWRIRPHQEEWVRALEALSYGDLVDDEGRPCHKLLIEAAPGSGKTDTVLEWLEWHIGREQTAGRTPQLGYISYSDDVAAVRSVAVRNTVEYNELYRAIFPKVVAAKEDGWGQSEWFLQRSDRGKKDPAFRAAGITGGILSYRFKSGIVIDDPHNEDNSATAHQRDDIWRRYSRTIKTRGLTGFTPIVLICTRWSEDDLPGRIKAGESGWKVIRTPALNSHGETYWPVEELEDGSHVGVTTEALLTLQREEPLRFLTQEMCMPPSAEGDIFRYLTFEPHPALESVVRAYQFWDTAFGEKDQNDYQALVEGVRLKDGRIVITHSQQRLLRYTRVKTEMLPQEWERCTREWGREPYGWVENKGSGQTLAQETQLAPFNIKNRDLVDRAGPVSDKFAGGKVVISDRWWPEKELYITQLKAFPHVGHDDLVAATLGLVEALTSGYVGPPPRPVVNRSGW